MTAFRKWMDREGLTYAQVSRDTGIPLSTLQKWGRLERKPIRVFRALLKDMYPSIPF